LEKKSVADIGLLCVVVFRRHVKIVMSDIIICPIAIAYSMEQIIQDAQLSQRDRDAGCVI